MAADDLALIASLHLRGHLPPRPRAAIVGARAAHLKFRELVPICVQALARRGWSLVSGGALGIDGDAHRAALAIDLPQLAVLPCGSDRPYPPVHAELFGELLRSGRGGVLYTQPEGREPSRAMFVSRNRHVVALSDALIVVEAERPSGTLHTGRLGLRRNVAVAAITGSRGAADLAGRGAMALPNDPVALASALERFLSGQPDATAQWPLHLLWLRTALQGSGAAGLSPDETVDPVAAAVALVEAELLGLVVEVGPGRWRRAGAP